MFTNVRPGDGLRPRRTANHALGLRADIRARQGIARQGLLLPQIPSRRQQARRRLGHSPRRHAKASHTLRPIPRRSLPYPDLGNLAARGCGVGPFLRHGNNDAGRQSTRPEIGGHRHVARVPRSCGPTYRYAVVTDVLELFGESTTKVMDWQPLVDRQQCPFLGRKCIKVRKSAPDTSIGTCSVAHGRRKQPMVICPFRLLERRKIFVDCLHLLSHEPGHELHVIPEVAVPNGR